VSKLATHLAIDRHQLGGRFVIQEREGSLRQRVEHIVLDYRREIIEASMKDLQQQIRQAAGNNEKIIELMKQLKEMQEIRNTIAKKLGTEIVF
jgi:DNA primase